MNSARKSVAHDGEEQAILVTDAETAAQADQEDQRAHGDRDRPASTNTSGS